ncbi:MAG: diguanylate cyclase [Dehalococcoidales bacterium]|nr:diguanylate cyclase [Dehalococcoidales bacterium]
MRTAIRSTDRAFRYGGDEFAVILPQTPVDAAVEVSERVRRQLAANLTEMDMPTTASLGVAGWPSGEPAVEALMAAADAALYRARKQGGNQSCLAAEPVGSSDRSTPVTTGFTLPQSPIRKPPLPTSCRQYPWTTTNTPGYLGNVYNFHRYSKVLFSIRTI